MFSLGISVVWFLGSTLTKIFLHGGKNITLKGTLNIPTFKDKKSLQGYKETKSMSQQPINRILVSFSYFLFVYFTMSVCLIEKKNIFPSVCKITKISITNPFALCWDFRYKGMIIVSIWFC